MATGATVNGLPGGPAYTMYTGFDPASIATNLGTVVAAKLASTLVSQVVVPHYPEGAVGQQIGASRLVNGEPARSALPKVAQKFRCNRLWIIKPTVGTPPRTRCQKRRADYRPLRGELRRWKGLGSPPGHLYA
jgi:hypothetical protein